MTAVPQLSMHLEVYLIPISISWTCKKNKNGAHDVECGPCLAWCLSRPPKCPSHRALPVGSMLVLEGIEGTGEEAHFLVWIHWKQSHPPVLSDNPSSWVLSTAATAAHKCHGRCPSSSSPLGSCVSRHAMLLCCPSGNGSLHHVFGRWWLFVGLNFSSAITEKFLACLRLKLFLWVWGLER